MWRGGCSRALASNPSCGMHAYVHSPGEAISTQSSRPHRLTSLTLVPSFNLQVARVAGTSETSWSSRMAAGDPRIVFAVRLSRRGK